MDWTMTTEMMLLWTGQWITLFLVAAPPSRPSDKLMDWCFLRHLRFDATQQRICDLLQSLTETLFSIATAAVATAIQLAYTNWKQIQFLCFCLHRSINYCSFYIVAVFYNIRMHNNTAAAVLLNWDAWVKPGFHSNAIACVGKQPIMVATASTEHSFWLALTFVAWKLPTQAIAFEWKPGFTHPQFSIKGILHILTEKLCYVFSGLQVIVQLQCNIIPFAHISQHFM